MSGLKAGKPRLTATRARELFDLNPETGVLMRKTARGGMKAGSVAGYVWTNGQNSYRRVNVNGSCYYAHRLACLIYFGEWPAAEVGHSDWNGLNNRIENLRASTHAKFTGVVDSDCEVRTTREGAAWALFSVVVDTDKDSETATGFVRVSLFGGTVEAMAPKLTRGTEVYCRGRLSLRRWTGTNGEKRSGLSLATNRVTLMGVGEGA